jgi:hypothetical protein
MFGAAFNDEELLDELEKLDAESIPSVRQDVIEVENR